MKDELILKILDKIVDKLTAYNNDRLSDRSVSVLSRIAETLAPKVSGHGLE